MLSKIFQRRFQSRSTPERKLAEIETLSSANPGQLSRLRALSEDEDPTVRLAAARQIGLRDQLCKMLVHEPDPDVRLELVNDLFNHVNVADEREIAALLIRHTKDAAARRQLATEVTAPRAVAALIQQSDDGDLALDIASTHRIASVRLAAAELVESQEGLQQLARTARDKSVQQLVRNRQREFKAAQAATEEAAERVDQLISNSAKLVDSHDTVGYAARIQVLTNQLDDLSDTIGDDQRHIVERNLRRCAQRAATLPGAAATAAEAPSAAPAESTAPAEPAPEPVATPAPHAEPEPEPEPAQPVMPAAEREAAERLLNELQLNLNALDFQDTEALKSFRDNALSRHQALQLSLVDDDVATHFDNLVSQSTSALACHELLSENQAAIQAFLDSDIAELSEQDIADSQDQLADWFGQLDWPQSQQQPAALVGLIQKGQALSEELGKRERDKQAAERKLDRLVHRLRGHVQRKQLKSALHTERDIDALLPTLDPRAASALERKLSAPKSALQQLKDWEDFSARPKREALCEKAEALQREPLSPDAQAEAVKALRQAWRSAGTVPLPEGDPLRERFQTAADAAFEHCAEWHERQQQLRAKNLQERERLVAELQTFIETVDWESPDIDVLTRAMRASRDEWRHYYPVRHSDARACQKQFDALLNRLNKAVKRGQQHNTDAREKLIGQAEALLESDDLDQAIQRAISLQNEWKAIGPVAAKQQRQQWKRFRKPMDALFDRRTAQRDSERAESNAKVSAARDALSELRALAEDQSQPLSQRARAAEDVLESLQPQLDQLPSKERKAFERDAANLMTSLHDAQRDAPRLKKIARLGALAEVARACAEAERAQQNGDAVSLDTLVASLDEQLGENTSARALIDDRVEAMSHPYSSARAEQQTELLSAALVELEIRADLPTPDAFRAERRACQIEMLEDRAGAAEDDSDALYALCERALAAGPILDTGAHGGDDLDAERRLKAIVDAASRWLTHA